MTGRAFVISIVTVSIVAIAGTCWLTPAPTPLPPPKVQAAVDRHAIATAVDTAEQHRLEREQLDERKHEAAIAAGRQRREDSAAVARHLADSLAQVASGAAPSAPDPAAERWKAAYDARTLEAEQLRAERDSAKLELQSAHRQLAQADSIAAVNLRHALRADSTVALLVANANDGDHCRIPGTFGLVHCPTRKQAFVGGVALGAAGVLLATGKIKIPIPLKF